MTDRRKLIHAEWRNRRWTFGPHNERILSPVPTEAPGGPLVEQEPAEAAMDVFCYRLERGFSDGRPAWRVVCEGIVLYVGPERPR